MTAASDMAKLAEKYIDIYLDECDTRRDAEARLAKSEEERATQSANLAAAMAECETLKRALFQMQEAAKDLTARLDASEADRAEWERRYVEADRALSDERADRDRYDARMLDEAAATARRLREVEAERDALRRAEAGKGAGDDGEADALELATTFHNAVAALDYRIVRFADCNYPDRNRMISAAKQTFAAVVRPRLAALQAKVDALTAERDTWQSRANEAEPEVRRLTDALRLAEMEATTTDPP